MKPIIELECVALTCDLPEHALIAGDVGTPVMVHGDGMGYEVKFFGYDGHTVALRLPWAMGFSPYWASRNGFWS